MLRARLLDRAPQLRCAPRRRRPAAACGDSSRSCCAVSCARRRRRPDRRWLSAWTRRSPAASASERARTLRRCGTRATPRSRRRRRRGPRRSAPRRASSAPRGNARAIPGSPTSRGCAARWRSRFVGGRRGAARRRRSRAALRQRGVGFDAVEFESERRVLLVRGAQVLERRRGVALREPQPRAFLERVGAHQLVRRVSACGQLAFGAAQVTQRAQLAPRSARACARRCAAFASISSRLRRYSSATSWSSERARHCPRRAACCARPACRRRSCAAIAARSVSSARSVSPTRKYRPPSALSCVARSASQPLRVNTSSASVCSASARSKSPSAIRQKP